MLRKEKEPSNRQEGNQDKSASRSEKIASRIWLPVYVVMMRHAILFSTINRPRNVIGTFFCVRDAMIIVRPGYICPSIVPRPVPYQQNTVTRFWSI